MVEPEEQPPELAGWGARAGAIVIDQLLLAVPFILGIVLAVGAAEDGESSAAWLAVLLLLTAFVAPFFYFTILNGNERGQTLGKRVTGVRARRTEGGPLGLGRAFGRYAFTFALGLFIGPFVLIDYLWPLWDDQNQALHDKVVDSIVVKA